MDVGTPLYPKHTPISLIEAQSQDEFVRRVKALPRHAVDDHSQCDYHPLVVCCCGACENKACQGRAKFQKQVRELIHPVLKRGHSNAVENVFIRFRSKDISRLHYHVSTNLALLQANLMQSLVLVTIGFLNSIAA